MKIGIVLGSIRQARMGEAVATWVLEQARQHCPQVDFELIDLKSFDVPLLTGPVPPGALNRAYDSAGVTAWGKAIDECDGFVFVTAEYNHGIPGAFKNAFDSIGPEWTGKPVAFVSYGADGGVRATEQWRQVVANFQMYSVRLSVPLSLFHDTADGSFAPNDRRPAELDAMLDQLVDATQRFSK